MMLLLALILLFGISIVHFPPPPWYTAEAAALCKPGDGRSGNGCHHHVAYLGRMSRGGARPSPCLTTADVLHLGGSPWSRTRGRCSSAGNSSTLAGDLRQGVPSPSGTVLTPPPHMVCSAS